MLNKTDIDDLKNSIPPFDAIRVAAARIAPYAHRTPVLTCRSIDQAVGASVFLKCENFQRAGAFKFRGACNTVFSLPQQQAAQGVATHSSGNHGAALALAASLRGIPCHVVMPRGAAEVKREAVAGFGATIHTCDATQQAREAGAEQVVRETGAEFVHPYNDGRVIAGQGTAAWELHHQVPDLDVIMAPVGGGGLLSGTAIASKALRPNCHILAGEPAGADDAARSLAAGKLIPMETPKTIADGLRTSLGPLTFAVICRDVHKIITVEEDQIIDAMRLVWSRVKIVIEPSSAVPLAAAIAARGEIAGQRIGIILSGGNLDLEQLPWQ